MLLAFVDETTRGSFYGFASVVADELATKSLTAALNGIVSQAAVDYGVSRTAEIHGHPLFHGREDWIGVGARARVAVFTDVIEAILDHDVAILMRSVDAGRLQRRQDREHYPVRFPPEQVCFQHILQRVDKLAARQGTYALVIADERGDRDRHRERFATYQTQGTPGVYMRTTLDRLLDTVHFAPSHESRMLQAADIMAFTYGRWSTVTESDERALKKMEKLKGAVLDSGKLFEWGAWP